MKTTLVIGVVVVFAGCSRQQPVSIPPTGSATTANSETQTNQAILSSDSSSNASSTPTSAPDKKPPVTIKPLTEEERQKLLGARLDGGMSYSFGQFGNMFLVSSRIQFGTGVGLVTSSGEIANTPLQSPFPAFYKPTLREFLDAIALQTSSEWKYDPSSKYFKSELEHKTQVENLAMFEFTVTNREKPFEVTLADGWNAIDKGNWVMHVPPSFPVGLDIYEMGTYSSEDKATENDFRNQVRTAVALEWAQRVKQNAVLDDLKPAKIATFDALFFESMVPSQLNKEIRWRHWVFMADNKCYFVVSTILPEFEDKIFPDVEKMLASFRVKTK